MVLLTMPGVVEETGVILKVRLGKLSLITYVRYMEEEGVVAVLVVPVEVVLEGGMVMLVVEMEVPLEGHLKAVPLLTGGHI